MKSVRSHLAKVPTRAPTGIDGFDEVGSLSQAQPLAMGLDTTAL
jgi:hypothetical protein